MAWRHGGLPFLMLALLLCVTTTLRCAMIPPRCAQVVRGVTLPAQRTAAGPSTSATDQPQPQLRQQQSPAAPSQPVLHLTNPRSSELASHVMPRVTSTPFMVIPRQV